MTDSTSFNGTGGAVSTPQCCSSRLNQAGGSPFSSSGTEFLPAIATMSLGKAGMHPLNKKLEAAALQGFCGIELFWDDLVAYDDEMHRQMGNEPGVKAHGLLRTSAGLRKFCDNLGLQVVSLQPFRNYDGITSPELHEERIREFKDWLAVAQALGAGVIGVPSTIVPNDKTHGGDMAVIAGDLAELAALAKPYNIRVAYENLCFAAHIRTWAQAWEVIVRAGDMEGIGFLVDTFNICGDSFADPSRPGGVAVNGEEEFRRSLKHLIDTVPMSSIPLLQVADAELMTPPIQQDHPWMDGCFHPKMAWSRNARLFPFEKPGYLPVLPVIRAMVRAGWKGWVSLEVFSRTTESEGEGTIWDHANRAWNSWTKLAAVMKWDMNPRNAHVGNHQDSSESE
ncbi:hypothetical protein S40285_03453 [Stachybotrys chlorohalonatus IBT 40285]|uniref:Xylose isomerase-like TIM barrel domain-containing protein n=1 Tax=Stachybotrys chlorohalonatus (strain IBT 40285) TaxID=1283841 RepID=A0A084QBV5_STAC4|nr:hypothetical protein S40285_03453 [Stachybotrys chlorohalonata IBT 40285]